MHQKKKPEKNKWTEFALEEMGLGAIFLRIVYIFSF